MRPKLKKGFLYNINKKGVFLSFIFLATLIFFPLNTSSVGENSLLNNLSQSGVQTIVNSTGYAISRWNNEVSFISPLQFITNTEQNENGQAIINTSAFDAIFYMNNPEEFEFEIVLHQQPPINSISIPIITKNLEFFYQDSLNNEESTWEDYYGVSLTCNETNCWDKNDVDYIYRPLNIVGSYAVYHSDKANGKYKTGKAFHIYRPFLIDAERNTAWGEITVTDDQMTLTAPQNFLVNAVYPVIIDPTFGYSSVGGTAYAITNFRHEILTEFEGGHEGNITNASVYIWCTDAGNCGGTNNFRIHAYSKGINLDNSFYVNSSPVTDVHTGAAAWQTVLMNGTLESNELYIATVQANNSVGARIRIYGDGASLLTHYLAGSDFVAPPNLSGASPQTSVRSVYISYDKTNPCSGGNCYFDSSYDLEDLRFNSGARLPEDYGGQIKFDITDLLAETACTNIDTANMQFYIQTINGAPDNDVRLHHIQDQIWNESSTAAILEAQTEYNQTDTTLSSTTVDTFTNITVTNLIKEACNRGDNYFTVRLQDPDNVVGTIGTVTDNVGIQFGAGSIPETSYVFTDRDATNATRRPRLFVNYTTNVFPVVVGHDPLDGEVIFDDEYVNYTCNVTDTDNNVTNITLYVFNNDVLFYNVTNTSELDASTLQQVVFEDVYTPHDGDYYKYFCKAYDKESDAGTSTNVSFWVVNSSEPITHSMHLLTIEKGYWQDNYYNVSDDAIEIDWKPFNVTCEASDELGLRYMALLKNGSVMEDVNYTNTGSYPTSKMLSYKYTDTISVIHDNSNWSCFSESISFNKSFYNSSGEENITILMNITPEIYIVHAIDTETLSLLDSQLDDEEITLNVTNYDQDNQTWYAFFDNSAGTSNATFRDRYPDNYSGNYKITWFDMTTRAYWYNTNGYTQDPMYDLFVNDSNWTEYRNWWGDEIEFHFHNHQWYNYSNYSGDAPSYDGQPYTPATWWNQIIYFDNTTKLGVNSTHNLTAQENIEEVFSQRIIVENEFPSVFRSGWLFEDNNLSLWLEGVIKYDFSVGSSSSTDTSEPIQNVYNWSDVEADALTTKNGFAYHPDETNFQNIGEMNRTMVRCQGGGIPSANMDEWMDQAYKRSRVIVCFYSHNYGGQHGIPIDANKTIDAIQDNLGNYPNLTFKYATAHEAGKWLDRCDDDTSPVLTVTQDANWYYVSSDEDLFASPYLAIETTNGDYVRGTVETTGVRSWKANKTEYSVETFLFAGTDECGNTFVQSQAITLEMLYPNSTYTANVTYPQNITVNFSVNNGGTYLTSGVEVINISINNETVNLCTLQGNSTYYGSNIWFQNCSVPNLTTGNYYNFSIWVNLTDFTDTTINSTELSAVYYPLPDTCTYSGAGDWIIELSDNCEVNIDTNITGILNFTGTGWVNISAEVNTTGIGKPPSGGTVYIRSTGIIRVFSLVINVITLLF